MSNSYKRKLIEVALPLGVISDASARESSIKRGKPTQLHKWWAGRPLVSARAVLWASIVDDPSAHPDQFPTEEAQATERARLFEILSDLVQWENSNDVTVLARARREIERSCGGSLPRILDPFGGGGVIPLESMRLGIPTFTGDLNPVAVLIQRAMMEIPKRFADKAPVHPSESLDVGRWTGAFGLAEDLEHYGMLLRSIAEAEVGELYSGVPRQDGSIAVPMAWVWARTVESPDPTWSGHVPLVRSWVLSKKPNRPCVWVDPQIGSDKVIRYVVRQGGEPPPPTVSRGNGICLATGAPMPNDYIIEEASAGRLGQVCLAIACEGPSGRQYFSPDEGLDAVASMDRPKSRLVGELLSHKKAISVPLYGMREWSDLFTSRQLLTLTTLVDSLPQVQAAVLADALSAGLPDDGIPLRDGGAGAQAYAEAILTYLAMVVSRLADWNNSLCAWEKNAEVSQHLFGRQAIPMVWDFAEANPFSSSTGSIRATINTLRKSLETLPDLSHATVDIRQMDARARLSSLDNCVLATDPPYYGQIPYADLADFFFAWLRPSLGHIWPEECATLASPKAEELIANQYRAGSAASAKKHFESGMRETFSVASSVADSRFPATIFYAFKASESIDGGQVSSGWETFLQGVLDGGWSIVATWPIRTENRTRLVALGTNSLASSVVLACRPRADSAALASRSEFVGALREELAPAVRLLQVENIAPVDLAQSAMGPGMRVFSRYARVVESDGSPMTVRSALGLINEVLGEVLTEEESELDADSRFALTWFEQYGHNPGPYGDADVLARAKDTSVAGVVLSGICFARDGRVRLLERHELEEDWSPVADRRATVWESVQHLISRLERSESDASELLTQLGGVADRSRQLTYLLFAVCEKNGWSDEAVAYNSLITAWPELSKNAGPTGREAEQQAWT